MADPWYEVTGPNTQEVKQLMFEKFIDNNIPSSQNIILQNIINSTVEQYDSQWGSYRGYYTFIHNPLIKNINDKIQQSQQIQTIS